MEGDVSRRPTAFRLPRLRHLLFFTVMGLSIWALIPPPEIPAASGGTSTWKACETKHGRKYQIRMAPRFYTPGSVPSGSKEPLRALDDVRCRFEELFPDTSVEFMDVPSNMREWLVTQLAGGQAPDIMQVEVEDVWQDIQKGWYVPLDRYLDAPNQFVPPGEPGSEQWWHIFKYESISRGKAAPDGNAYSIIFDMIETGLFYNKRLFSQHGITPPETWGEFDAMQRKLRAAGYIPTSANSAQLSDWGVDLLFDQVYADQLPGIDLIRDPKREIYLDGYLDWDEIAFLYQEKHLFTPEDPRWVEMWRLIKDWRQHWNKDISPLNTGIYRMFIKEEAAMMWSSSMMVRYLEGDPDVTIDWGVFYPPRLTKEDSQYASDVEMCVIGGAAMQYSVTNSAFNDTGDIETSEKLNRVIAFLQFMTLPGNADSVINEAGFFIPNVKGVKANPKLAPFEKFLERRYTTTKWSYTFDLRFNEIMNRMMMLYVDGEVTEEEFLSWMDRNLDAATEDVIRRKNLDLEKYERIWQELSPNRQPGMAGYGL